MRSLSVGCHHGRHDFRSSAHLSPDLRDRRIRHPGRRRQGQGAEGRWPAGHRVRGGRARLPHPRLHRRGRPAGVRRPAVPQVHARGRAARAPRGGRGQDRAGLRLPGQRGPGADHQRRQAGRVRGVRHAAGPGGRGAHAHPVLDHLPGVHRAGRRGARARDDRRADRLPGQRGRPGSGPHRPDQGAAVRVALQPDRRGVPAGAGGRDRPVGRRARHLGRHRRDLRAPRVRRRAVLVHPGGGA